MSTMTLEQALSAMRSVSPHAEVFGDHVHEWADAIDAHRAQPAQAVDVGRLHNLIGQYWDLAYAEGKEGRDTDTHTGEAQRTWQAIEAGIRALSGEKVGPVDGWQPIETAPKDGEDILATDGTAMLVTYWYGASTGWLYRYTDHGVDGWSPTHWMPLPASPAPDKEG